MLVNSFVLGLATAIFSTGVSGQIYIETLTNPTILGQSSYTSANSAILKSRKETFWVNLKGDFFDLTYMAQVVGHFYLSGLTGVRAAADGRLEMIAGRKSTFVGLASTCNRNVVGTWSLRVNDYGRLWIQSTCGTVAFDNGVLADMFPMWAFEHINGYKYDPNNDLRNVTAGNGTFVYYLDAGLPWNGAPVLERFSSTDFLSLFSFSSHHGNGVLNVAHNKEMGGMTQGLRYGFVKITEGKEPGDIVHEPSIIKAFRFIMANHTMPVGSNQRIIHTSHSFPDGNSAVVDCAIQWAFKQGTYVIQPAGNNNVLRNTRNPYALTIGAFVRPSATTGKSIIHADSVYGQTVDLWAPANSLTKSMAGTSLATAYTTAAVAHVVSYHPAQLYGRPNKGYKYMLDLANTTVILGTDAKVSASPRAGTKAISIRNMKTLAPSGLDYFDTVTAPDFCGQVGLDANIPNWDALLAKADVNRWGGLVYESTFTSATTTSGRFVRYE